MTWGIDYAAPDANRPPDFAKLKAAGCTFVWLRATYATSTDATFVRDWAPAAVGGLRRGAYMFPVLNSKFTPEQQVASFVQVVQSRGGLRMGHDFPPCLDVEFPQGIAGTGLDRAGVLAWLRRAVSALKAAFGCWPVIYTSGRVWNGTDADCLGNPPAPDLARCPLWLARYPYKTRIPAVLPPPATLAAPPVPTPWGDFWIAHQYQGDALGVPGISATADIDRLRGAARGDHGGHVAWAQAILSLKADGVFGPVTEAALKAMQHAHALPETGVLDLATVCLLAWA